MRWITRTVIATVLALLPACRWTLRESPRVDAAVEAAVTDAAVTDASVPLRLPRCPGPGADALPDVPFGPLRASLVLRRPVSADIGRGACLGDLDGDGAQELVVLRADPFAEVYDPDTLCLRTTLTVPPYARACEVADLDGDGRPELALAHSIRFGARLTERWEGRALDSVTAGHVEPDDATGARWRWRWPMAWSFAEDRNVRGVGHVLAALDLDGDGRRELAVAGTITGEAPVRQGFVRVWEFAPTGCAGERACPDAVHDHEFFDTPDVNDLFVTSVDDDPAPELVADLGCTGGGVWVFDGAWSSPPRNVASLGQSSHGAFADLDGDGAQDYLAATTPRCNGGYGPPTALRWLRPEGGLFRHYAEARHPTAVRTQQPMVAAVDVLGDPRPEALFCARDTENPAGARMRCDLYAFEAPHIDLVGSWTEPDALADILSRMLVADVNRDGHDDALVVTQSRVYLFRASP